MRKSHEVINYTIDDFWIPQLGQRHNRNEVHSLVRGWGFVNQGLGTFKEAPLTLNEEYSEDVDPADCSIILVSAPGAVGKSTLARQIAYCTGSIYIDLAKSEPVGANTLSGGLFRSRLTSSWESDEITVMIDGLDEAKLRVTEEGFQAFLSDISVLSKGRQTKTLVFGRTKTIEDAWLYIPGRYQVAVLEIGYYGGEASIEFAEATLQEILCERVRRGLLPPNRLNFPSVDREAVSLLLERLRSQTEGDAIRFAGYAPVLQAVAERVASEANPINLVNELKASGQPPLTLQSITSSILEREQGKLKQIELQDPTLYKKLYTPEEQLDRLVARTYNTTPPSLPEMSPKDLITYTEKVEPWLEDHPFLGGSEQPPSAVFEAAIKSQALQHEVAAVAASQTELERGDLANPFLYLFYNTDHRSEVLDIQPEHVGVYYNSVRASLANGEMASLTIEDDYEDDSTFATGEIEIIRRGIDDAIQTSIRTIGEGPIRLGHHIRDTDLYLPRSRVEIGPNTEVILAAPVNIECKELAIETETLRAETRADAELATVVLRANKLDGSPITRVPITYNADLFVSWPGSEAYPWHNFQYARSPETDANPEMDEALRRFRIFVLSFRRDKARALGRHQNKIEGTRMVKGTGQAVLDLMVESRILSRDQARYSLSTDRLSALTLMTYSDFLTRNFTPQARRYVAQALSA